LFNKFLITNETQYFTSCACSSCSCSSFFCPFYPRGLVAKAITAMAFVTATIAAIGVCLIAAVRAFRLTELVEAFGLGLAKVVEVCHRYPFKSFFGYFIGLPSPI
jgi:hypothetical protein